MSKNPDFTKVLFDAPKADVSLKLSKGSAPKVYAVNLSGERVGEMKSSWKNGTLSFHADTAGINNTAIMVYEITR